MPYAAQIRKENNPVHTREVQQVPLLDLQKQYEQVGASIEAGVIEVLRSGNYILGKYGSQLEHLVAQICGVKHAIGVANGTDALILALAALDIGLGDEVITPPFTFAATAEAIVLRGATPVFVDVDETTFNIDPSKIEAAITPRTKAIMPVHLYGQAAEMDSIKDLAKKYNLRLIEDNAQAIGALYKGKPTGSWGDIGCISFYPTKNLGACGDAGMVTTNDDALADKLRMLRAHGSRQRYLHELVGTNSRLDEIQAVALVTKASYLAGWNAARQQISAWYKEALSGIPGLSLPACAPDRTHVWHQYTICFPFAEEGKAGGLTRTRFIQELASGGVGSMCYYPIPIHLQPAFASLGYTNNSFPVAEKLSKQVVSLPMYPELSQQHVAYVAQTIKSILTPQATLTSTPAVASIPG